MKKRNLTKSAIIEAAIKLIENEGLENLSMRKLAATLNIEAASLYNHIQNKAELFDSIQEDLYSRMSNIAGQKSWQAHLISLATHTRQGLLQVPQLAMLFATRPTITLSALQQAEITLAFLIKAGFKPSQVLAIFRNLHVFVLGHVLAEVGQVPGEKNAPEPKLANINIDHYPNLKRASTYKSNMELDKGFKLGLENMITGLEKLLVRKVK